MKSVSFAVFTAFTLATASLFAAPAPISLWPKQAPGETGSIGEEKDTSGPKSGLIAGKPLIRLGNVSQPTITVYRPAKEKDTGASVIICPGGGYSILAYDLEGSEVCEWLNTIGVTGVLLKYRVPKRPGLEKHTAALQDAQRAIGLVRAKAGEFGVDPKKIGILGFSAGGHLAAAASTNYEKRTYEPVDDADKASCRPDFTVLIYPAYLTVKEKDDVISPELPITANTPQTFLAMTEDDGVRVEGPLFYYLALKKAKVSAEMHLYPTGGHGYGLRPSQHTVTTWPKRVEEWMQVRGLLTATK
ncbi:MAG: alpha/beta hydrolase [Proteobacteria bacterium]|nr:alpha/beta hydrolase [Pseudomonadota bacterium]